MKGIAMREAGTHVCRYSTCVARALERGDLLLNGEE